MSNRFEKPLRIRFAHCDPAGIVFFPQYLVMLNGHLEDWFTEGLGVSYAELLGPRRVGTPTVRLECDFTAISRPGDEVVVGLQVKHLGRSSFSLDFDIRAGDQLRMKAHKVLVFTSLDTHAGLFAEHWVASDRTVRHYLPKGVITFVES